ncbi:PREDICTED: caveolin-2-like [Gavialis gangeticus]|uniref:caveolin-2-like n=1 Tax=Gavialis gangeticus TaxID=94835 RepID=UPI00092F2857|nr:PREDICTED: caveolin-2-like [Gavialis gangeticus]
MEIKEQREYFSARADQSSNTTNNVIVLGDFLAKSDIAKNVILLQAIQSLKICFVCNCLIFHFLLSRIVIPFVKTCLMVLPSVQTLWKSMTDVLIAPLCQSMGRCFAAVNIRLDQE